MKTRNLTPEQVFEKREEIIETPEGLIAVSKVIHKEFNREFQEFIEEYFYLSLNKFNDSDKMVILSELIGLDGIFAYFALVLNLDKKFCLNLFEERVSIALTGLRFSEINFGSDFPINGSPFSNGRITEIDINIAKVLLKLDIFEADEVNELFNIPLDILHSEEFILKMVNDFDFRFFELNSLGLTWESPNEEETEKIINLLRMPKIKARILNDKQLVSIYDDNIDEKKEGEDVLDWLLDPGTREQPFSHLDAAEKEEEFERLLNKRRNTSFYYRAYGIKGSNDFDRPDWNSLPYVD